VQRLSADGAIAVSPAPGESGVYARRYFHSSLVAFDAEGNELGGYAPDPRESFQGVVPGMEPWGDVPTEMRFVAGTSGTDDAGTAWSLLVPYVEEPPFAPEPEVLLRDEAIGSAIRDGPAGENVIGTLASNRARVVGAEELAEPAADPLHCEFVARHADFDPDCEAAGGDFARYFGLRQHVVTDDGIDGWVLVRAGIVGL
jgi:hypothetical protein